jgi:hypothetical protein
MINYHMWLNKKALCLTAFPQIIPGDMDRRHLVETFVAWQVFAPR